MNYLKIYCLFQTKIIHLRSRKDNYRVHLKSHNNNNGVGTSKQSNAMDQEKVLAGDDSSRSGSASQDNVQEMDPIEKSSVEQIEENNEAANKTENEQDFQKQ